MPPATVSRLPVYLRCLNDLAPTTQSVSSDQLAEMAGCNPAQVRKDLSFLGAHGVRGVGYVVQELRTQVHRALGLTREWPVAIVGAGNLGAALAHYGGFAEWGFHIVAMFDVDRTKVASVVNGITVRPMSDLTAAVAECRVAIGIIATPAAAAQDVADRLVAAGVTSILNFAPTVLRVPDGVVVRRVDLSTELQILSFHLSRPGESRRADQADSPAERS
jgi:redox-sensing transcriptional repressor